MGKTEAKFTGLDKVKEKLLRSIEQSNPTQQELNQYAELTVDQIRKRTRARLEDYKQDEILPSTIKIRDSIIKSGTAHKNAKKSQSNLTLSGQLLDAISYTVFKTTLSIKIFLKKARKPYKYKTVNGKIIDYGEKTDNLKVKEELEQQGRHFMFISKDLMILLENKIKTNVRKKLREYIKSSKISSK